MPATKPEVSLTVEKDSQLSRITFKAPVFWENDPELWFFQVESQFAISGISNDYQISCGRCGFKFQCIIFAQSNLLLKDLQLGDKRPSHLLSEIRNLATAKMEDGILQTLWLQRLPANLQQILPVCNASLDEFEQISDKIYEVSGCSLTVALVETKPVQVELDAIKAELTSLKNMVKKLSVSEH
ncbi:hypothetical protein AVEN_89080-1 [Araneus ventricosus]|uniref:DUF7041 domain-containing protein n=1 Tax=Araneus ventricosus TaxID=182803 RepID=A0A4Y2B1R2_ARAVE|nr:hypothetical protein AVEN_89080-1 [Araneus ventricosus]